jgi:hypothetical protein
MALLVLVALAMMSLSTIEMRSSRNANAQNEAKANARLALMLAIGDLQKNAGGDKTITAQASILDSSGFSGISVDPSKGRYTIAFKTDQAQGNWKTSKTEGFGKYLVSGTNEDLAKISYGQTDVINDATSENLVRMTSPLADANVQVVVPKVSMQDNSGKYAYWVEGLGSKSSIGVVDIGDVKAREHLAPDRVNVKSVLDGATGDFSWLPGRGDEKTLEKILTPGTADILAGRGGALAPHEHWLGLQHYTVPIDTKRGALKYDLSAFLSLSKQDFDSVIADKGNLIGERIFAAGKNGAVSPTAQGVSVGPKWKQIRSFYQMSGINDVEVQEQTDEQMGVYPLLAGFVEMYCCTDSKYYAPAGKPPFLRDYWFNYRGAGVNIMNAHMAPIVKLWNPYNKRIKKQDYTVVVANSNHQYPGGLHADDAEVQWVDGRFLSYLPKPLRFDHRYVVKDVSFEPGEVKVFSLRDGNVYLDMNNGTYKPFTGKPVGKRVDVLKKGYILAELTEGAFTGHCLWDLHFTKKELSDYDFNQLNYVSGRANGGHLVGGQGFGTDGGDIQIYDTSSSRKVPFQLRAGDIVNWNLKLFRGVKPKPVGPELERPLINIRNINVDSKGAIQSNEELVACDPPTTPVFADGVSDTYMSSTWARRFSMRMLNNYGDGTNEEALFRPRGDVQHPNNVKWVSNYNPRAAFVGMHPREYTKTKSTFYPGDEITINNTKTNAAANHGLGTPANYVSGMLLKFTDTDFIRMDKSIGYADTGESITNCILFELPDTEIPETHFFSVGQLRHANISIENGDFGSFATKGFGEDDWFADNMQPAYPVGESNPSPYIKITSDTGFGRYEHMSYVDGNNAGESTNVDLSWWMNDSLWDSYFFSAPRTGKTSSYNPRILVKNGQELLKTKAGVEENAGNVLIGGTMNLNNTNVNVWTAFLMSTLGAEVAGKATQGVPFSRFSKPIGQAITAASDDESNETYNGYRVLSEVEVTDLAIEIVEKVKERGPFFSVSDFVNRVTSEGATDKMRLRGLLQEAIDEAGGGSINKAFTGRAASIPNADIAGMYNADAFAGDIQEGIPGYLTQGDILARTGHLMTVRDDTFVIRAYGESSVDGKIAAKAWCEAVVQRTSDYVDDTEKATTPYDELQSITAKTYGRKLKIVSFRWISKDEVN